MSEAFEYITNSFLLSVTGGVLPILEQKAINVLADRKQ